MPKGLFIGLGGTGVKTVAQLKAFLFQKAYGSDKEAMDADCSFIFYDTDEATRNDVQRDVHLQRTMGDYPIIGQEEYIDAGPVNPCRMYENARFAPEGDEVSRRILSISADDASYFPNRQLNEGTGAQRTIGRMGFVYARGRFVERIERGLWPMVQLARDGRLDVDHPSIWVFSSCCGGTGSSVLLDVLYLVDRLFKQHVANVNPYVRLVLYMPTTFIKMNKVTDPIYCANSYATMWELNEFRCNHELRNDGERFGAFAAMPDFSGWEHLGAWPVCSYVMAIDTESQMGRITLDQMYEYTAELCYFHHTDSAGLLSRLENDMSPWGPYYRNAVKVIDDPSEWSRFLVAFGFRAIVKPDDLLKEYLRDRFRVDLYGALLGNDFEIVWPIEEDRRRVVKEFADQHIFKHLVCIDNPDDSPEESLYGQFLHAFDSIPIPSLASPSKDELLRLRDAFIVECKQKAEELLDAFHSMFDPLSKMGWMNMIEESVKDGVEYNIVKYGLKYTYSLLNRVDDYHCEPMMDKCRAPYLKTLEDEMDAIVKGSFVFQRGKKKAALEEKMAEFRRATATVVAMESIRDILDEITRSKTGLLERIRKGDAGQKGIAGMIQTFNQVSTQSEFDYKYLARTFAHTQHDICVDYFPHVSDFVDGANWKPGNLFEELYGALNPRIEKLVCHVADSDFLFCDMAFCDSGNEYARRIQVFLSNTDRFIEEEINGNQIIQTWLDKDLNTVFNDAFITDFGLVEEVGKHEYVESFLRRIPVFYPSRPSLEQNRTRLFFYSASLNLARSLGYKEDDLNMQYIHDSTLGNRMYVYKFELGHAFCDYMFFPELARMYREKNVPGSHIHKDLGPVD